MASVTGLRRRALGSLTVESFDFDSAEPSVTVIATRTKNRKTAVLPLRSDLVAELKPWLARKKQGAILFPIEKGRMYDVIRADMKEAGLTNEKNGKRVDFHALRVTMISHLGINGVSVQVAQKLARHSTPILTANIYTQPEITDLQKAVEQVPSMSIVPAVDQANGTNGS
jgi:integrase